MTQKIQKQSSFAHAYYSEIPNSLKLLIHQQFKSIKFYKFNLAEIKFKSNFTLQILIE